MFGITLFVVIIFTILGVYFWNENKLYFVAPKNNRNWKRNQKKMPEVVFHNEMITVQNVRDTRYTSATKYNTFYKEITINSNKLTGATLHTRKLNFPGIHITTIFHFSDGQNIAISIQMRRFKDIYNFIHSVNLLFNPSELIYIIATERDILEQERVLRHERHIYKMKLSEKECKELFIDMSRRSNDLREKPEFYSSFSNNCIINTLKHVNHVTHINFPDRHYSYLFSESLVRLLQKENLIEKKSE
jgi:hypothetical protein